MTGDKIAVAEKMAKEAGIENIRAECLPADKLDVIGGLQSEGHKVSTCCRSRIYYTNLIVY